MKRHQLEHVLRAAGAVTDSSELIVIGSQAILAAVPDPPAPLLVSEEADLYVPGREDLSVLIDRCGESEQRDLLRQRWALLTCRLKDS